MLGTPDVAAAADDEGQLRTGHGVRPPLPVRADAAGPDLGLELPGVDHDPWVEASDDILAAVEEFVAAIGRDPARAALPA